MAEMGRGGGEMCKSSDLVRAGAEDFTSGAALSTFDNENTCIFIVLQIDRALSLARVTPRRAAPPVSRRALALNPIIATYVRV